MARLKRHAPCASPGALPRGFDQFVPVFLVTAMKLANFSWRCSPFPTKSVSFPEYTSDDLICPVLSCIMIWKSEALRGFCAVCLQ